MLANWLVFAEFNEDSAQVEVCALMRGPVRELGRKQDSMAEGFFVGPDGAGACVW